MADTLEKVLSDRSDCLDFCDAELALAACEVVARMQGNFGERDDYTAEMDKWVEKNKLIVSPKLVDDAIAVIDRILSGPSEILEVWSSDPEFLLWKENIRNLRKRIRL